MAVSGPVTLGLPRNRRILKPGDFGRVRQTGRRAVQGCLILNWLEVPDRSHSRLGVVTSKRIGGAVIRSRARRLMRECFRKHQWKFVPPVDMVLVARNSIRGKRLAEVEADFFRALHKSGLLIKPE